MIVQIFGRKKSLSNDSVKLNLKMKFVSSLLLFLEINLFGGFIVSPIHHSLYVGKVPSIFSKVYSK